MAEPKNDESTENGPTEDLSLPAIFGSIPIASVLGQHEEVLSQIEAYDPLRLASCFGSLLADPSLQANCLRLEILTHVSLALGKGTKKPTPQFVSLLFSALGGGPAGWMEDPAEDVFVSNISTPRGNFRVLEGIWESAGFHTQRVVNALENIPIGSPYNEMREAIYCLLKLSDEVCDRAGLTRNIVGESEPQDKIPKSIRDSLSSKKRAIRFSDKQLEEFGIELDDLAEFGFDPSKRGKLAEDIIGHSDLERYPLVYRNGEIHLLLPTAVTAAIRRFIVEKMEALGLARTFAATLAYEYAELLSNTPLLGQHAGADLEFRETDNGLLAGVSTRADEGFFVNLVFIADTLQGFGDGGLIGMLPKANHKKVSEDIEKWIDHAYEAARKTEDFRGGLSIIVACGIGRGMLQSDTERRRENWRVEFMGAPDFVTLSHLHGFNSLSLLRILDGRDRLAEIGVNLQNVNGLLNMVAWARSLGGHLVPHADIPESFGTGDGHNFLLINQNGLLQLRQEVAQSVDEHVLQDITGRWLTVFKDGGSLFQEDRDKPYYVSPESGSRWPTGVYEAPNRAWWVELQTTDETSGYLASQRHEMLRTWLRLAAPVLDRTFNSLLPPVLLWKARFKGHIGDRADPGLNAFLQFEDTIKHIDIWIDGSTLLMSIDEEFEHALQNPENVGERALVTKLVEGIAQLAGVELGDEEKLALVAQIVTGPDARQAHAFRARRFRDFVHNSVWHSPIKIDTDDAAIFKLGLGWRTRDRSSGGEIEGKRDCTEYLNGVVKLLEDEICQELKTYNREAVIMIAFLNHESAVVDRDRWRRTSRAVIALHNDKESARKTIIDHEFELNAVFQASRLLVEFAICECPMEGGKKPGRRDISRLMAKILTISGLGGWSDAIHWDAMEPRIVVRPLGDIHANVSFHEEVLTPYSREAADITISESIAKYPEHFTEENVTDSDDRNLLDDEFWEAFKEQVGASIDTVRKYVDALENLGIKRGKAILKLKRSELLNLKLEDETLDSGEVAALVDFITFKTRANWREIPDGFNAKDIFPWRYRRALTVLRRPLILLNEAEDDPSFVVAPGLVRDALVYMVGHYHKGDFPRWQLKPKMKRWAGKSRDRIGSRFTCDVAARLNELGWNTETEVAVTKLLATGFDRDYGDVDVVAWNPDTGRVLLMECKDLQYRKTDGEVAEQLADFRGQLKSDGKPDYLLKHLNRVDLILGHTDNVARYLRLNNDPVIEGHLAFRNPVPMKYAWEHISKKITLSIFSTLDQI